MDRYSIPPNGVWSLRIEEYAIIGDCESAALIGRNGSVDWLCWPRFDSGACFSALVGNVGNGRWLIAPRDEPVRVTRRYQNCTIILETTFETGTGAVTLLDFMPPRRLSSHLVRIVRGARGQVPMRVELVIRFDYGSLVPWVTRSPDGTLRAVGGADMVALRTPAPLHGENLKTVGEVIVSEGETVPFVLSYGASYADPPVAIDWRQALTETTNFWKEWSQRCPEQGPYADAIRHSLMVLKALTYAPTGGIVAAPTTSLPEQLGGSRNWDYRYCWLRDATFTLLALVNSGYFDEARRWRDWLLRAIADTPSQVQILYGITGTRRVDEWEIPWLSGYEGARPVRVGNAARSQLQLDIFGEIMDALHIARCAGLGVEEPAWALQTKLLEHLESIWQQPDEGVWEIRGPRQHFTFSKVMAWVAFDRAIKSAEKEKLAGPVEKWRTLSKKIHREICENAYDRELNSFTQSYGSRQLDASLLLLALVGFLPPSDPRILGTVRAIETSLMKDGFVRRYQTKLTDDGLPGSEGVFLACSFWLADVYVLLGRQEDARRLFERLLSLRNDVGLLSEEYDPADGRMLGNFPQALSHIGLINSAHNLMRLKTPAEQRSGHKAK
jgi:GH15 family glucan-1,4-alpha-glucosidase